MKKVALLSLILILLTVSVVPVMAAGGSGNGHGNGTTTGQGNGNGNQGQGKNKDKNRGPSINTSGNRMRTPFYLQGVISSVGAGTITVTLIHGNAQVKQYLGKTLEIKVTDAVVYKLTQGGEEQESNRVLGSIADLAKDQRVAIHGNLVDTVFTARLITIYLQAPSG